MDVKRAMPLVGVDAFVEFALWYAEYLGAVFPCKPVGKEPLTPNGFKNASTDPTQIRAWWDKWPTANIAVCVPHADWWVLDIDARYGGVERLMAFEAEHGPLPRTLTCLTGSGGGSEHRYFAGTARNKALNNKAVDVQGPGSYVIVPPSIHPESGQRYEWECDYGPDDIAPQDAPDWLKALVTAAPDAASHDAVPFDPHAIIPNGQRNTTVWHVLRALHRSGASVDALRAQAGVENARCESPLDADELERLVVSAQNGDVFAQLHVGNGTPISFNTAPPGFSSMHAAPANYAEIGTPSAQWRQELFAKKSGELYQNVTNMKLIFDNHPHWHDSKNALWWDTVRGRPMIGTEEIDQPTMIDLCDWLGRAERLPVTRPALVETCVITQCKKYKRDLLQEWIAQLPPWDQTPRLTSWLHALAGAAHDVYTQDVSRVLPVSMIARALHPGVHYRFVVIFRGEEEIGKTALVKALATPEWYVELSMNLESKESHMMLQGVWVAELSELDSFTRTEETRLKSFITINEDSYVPKFSNFREKSMRRAIFVGTTNDECFLKGQSGNTRYLPITLNHAVDLAGFQAQRDQLFAEARDYYHAHPDDWWQLSSEALEQARDEREKHRIQNIYEQPLHEWLEYGRFKMPCYEHGSTMPVEFTAGETSWPEIARWYLEMDTPEKWKDRSAQMQIAQALRAIGWRVQQVWKNGRNCKLWMKGSEDND